MSGTIGADFIQTSAGTINLLNLRRGESAWVNFNGTGTVAIRDSLNVSSVTDNGVGDYTVNFTTAMANANYAATCGGGDNGTQFYVRYTSLVPTVSAIRLGCIVPNGSAGNDPQMFSVVIVGGT